MKIRTLRRPVLVFLILLFTAGCIYKTTPPAEFELAPRSPAEISIEESEGIALSYLLNSSTYRFDGMEESVRLAETITLRCPYCWEFAYDFSCRHAGYGDREGKMLAQVITPHRAKITVVEGRVERAVMDDRWDMMGEKMLGGG